MEFSTPCRCCLIHTPDYDLKKPYPGPQKTEIYADILKECFEIHVMSDSSDYQGICTICVVRLRDALDFKHQVIRCQNQLMKRNIVTDEAKTDCKKNESKVKQEFPEHEDQDGFDLRFYDVKQELPDLECLKEEILCLDKEIVKLKSEKKNGKRTSVVLDGTNDKQKNAGRLLFNNVSETVKYKKNIQNILKHSNCTPFFNKTIAGVACAYCKEFYSSIELLRKHTIEKHDKGKIVQKRFDGGSFCIKLDITDLKCNVCNMKLNFIVDLKKHLIKEHNIKFYAINDYFLEFKLTNSDILKCALCNSTFETFKMLLQHMNGHYRNYVCDVCDLGFINRHRLNIHKKTHEVGVFKCSFCDKVFSTRVRQKCHEKYSHNTAPRYTTNCSHCDKSFTSYYQRNRHMTTEHNISAATYKCNICDTLFILKSKLTSHIKKVHLMEKNHTCAQCGVAFFDQHSLHDHMVKHNGEKVFECTVCHKAYARKKTLREHMRIHNNDRRFKCGVCSMAFVQKCSMKSHMLSNHGITLSEFESASNECRPINLET